MRQLYAKRLVVRLRAADGRGYRGIVIEAGSPDGDPSVLIDFPRGKGPVVPIGEKVELSFENNRLPVPLIADGTIAFRSEDRFRLRYQVLMGGELRNALCALSVLNDRRLAARVRPFSRAPIAMRIGVRGEGVIAPVTVNDVSATGVAISLSAEYERELFASWDLDMEIILPGESRPLSLAGKVRYRSPGVPAVRYGVDFDGENTGDFGKKQERIFQYVSACQSVALRNLMRAFGRPAAKRAG